jgi:hypothetical protein
VSERPKWCLRISCDCFERGRCVLKRWVTKSIPSSNMRGRLKEYGRFNSMVDSDPKGLGDLCKQRAGEMYRF